MSALSLPTSVCGVILVTNDVERLAAFYRDMMDLPLEREEHGELPVHYGVDVGITHLGIHPPASFGRGTARPGGSVFALQVDDLDSWLDRLDSRGIRPVVPKHDEGFGPVAAIEDPDGNLIELVELNYDFEKEEA
jgi:catechol 2,3-dioxygenase-like lactoylglutathione lyase family enzyme